MASRWDGTVAKRGDAAGSGVEGAGGLMAGWCNCSVMSPSACSSSIFIVWSEAGLYISEFSTERVLGLYMRDHIRTVDIP